MDLTQLGRQDGYALVLGDLVIDETIEADNLGVHRSEHTCHMRAVGDSEVKLGAAANVARGVKALGWKTMLATSMCGPEEEEELCPLLDAMAAAGMRINLCRPMRRVARRLRIRNRRMGDTWLRLDMDPPRRLTAPNTVAEYDRAWMAALTNMPDLPTPTPKSPAVIVVNDHGRGFMSDARSCMMRSLFPGVPRVVDPGPSDFARYLMTDSPTVLKFNAYQAADYLRLLFPAASDGGAVPEYGKKAFATVVVLRADYQRLDKTDGSELCELLTVVWQSLARSGAEMAAYLQRHALVMTCGAHGAVAAIADGENCLTLHSELTWSRPVTGLCDPCGAGDTFLATLATTLALDRTWQQGWTVSAMTEHLRVANTAAGMAVRVPGTAVISELGLREELAK